MSIERHKVWVARSRQTEGEFDRDIPGKLFMFYDGPPKYNTQTHKWEEARCLGEIPNYMFPKIEEGQCVEFTYNKFLRKYIN